MGEDLVPGRSMVNVKNREKLSIAESYGFRKSNTKRDKRSKWGLIYEEPCKPY